MRFAFRSTSSAGPTSNALTARQAVRSGREGLTALDQAIGLIRERVEAGSLSPLDLERALITRDRTLTAVERAGAALGRTQQDLAALLVIPDVMADRIELRGTLHDRAPPPPPTEVLIEMALHCRPDLAAARLAVRQDRAEIDRARADRFSDVFLFYTPYAFTNNAWIDKQSTTAWSVGALISVPVFDRNQGEIRRAGHAATQTQLRLENRCRQVAAEVRNAVLSYETTRSAVVRIESSTLPRARRLRDGTLGQLLRGKETLDAYLKARSEFDEVVGDYLKALVEHRRSMLRLNTAVGCRVLP